MLPRNGNGPSRRRQSLTRQLKLERDPELAEHLVTFLEREYRPHARASLAARDLPNGEPYYRAEVARETTTSLTPPGSTLTSIRTS